jgi:hypothetical protein
MKATTSLSHSLTTYAAPVEKVNHRVAISTPNWRESDELVPQDLEEAAATGRVSFRLSDNSVMTFCRPLFDMMGMAADEYLASAITIRVLEVEAQFVGLDGTVIPRQYRIADAEPAYGAERGNYPMISADGEHRYRPIRGNA